MVLFYRYFDDEDESFEGAYQPAPGSPGPQRKDSSDSDEDPLDAFMAGIEQEVRTKYCRVQNGIFILRIMRPMI